MAVADGVAIETQPREGEEKRVLEIEPTDNTTFVPWVNAVLASYVGLQLLNTVTAVIVLQEGAGEGCGQHVAVGMLWCPAAVQEWVSCHGCAGMDVLAWWYLVGK